MNTNWKNCLSLFFVLAAGFPALSQTAPDRAENLRITIHVFDAVGLPFRTLAQAEMEASRIFEKAGLQTRWLHGPLSLSEARMNTSCDEPWGATDLDLRISTRSQGRRSGAPRSGLGYAFPLAERNHASIYYEHVQELAEDSQGRPSLAEILGHVMTHEIGHLLFRSVAHSRTGIMRARWNGEDLACAGRGVLLFTREQAANLQTAVQRRINGTDNR